MEKSKFSRATLGIKLPSTDSRNIVPVEFEEINHLELQYIYLRDNASSNSPELLNHCFGSTSTDASSDYSPSKLCQERYFSVVAAHPWRKTHEAAIKLQKVYKSYITRRNLPDCAVVIEELWWKALDFASLKHSSISFFNDSKPEETASRWARARTRAAKVGKGLSKSDKAQQLSLRHWLEAIDPRHRYGHNLQFYYDIWFESESTQPFFYWLDVGDGKEVNLEKCSRSLLQKQCIQYLGPKERKAYEVAIKNGKLIYKLTELPVHTAADEKWIFVLSTCGALFVGQKKKGKFQHSSFLAGGATTCAGRLVLRDGFLKAIWPHSGHYLPTEENFKDFINFLKENNVDLTNTKTCYIGERDHSIDHSSSFKMSRNHNVEITMETKALEKDQSIVLVESTYIDDPEENRSSDEFNQYL